MYNITLTQALPAAGGEYKLKVNYTGDSARLYYGDRCAWPLARAVGAAWANAKSTFRNRAGKRGSHLISGDGGAARTVRVTTVLEAAEF